MTSSSSSPCLVLRDDGTPSDLGTRFSRGWVHDKEGQGKHRGY